MNPAGRRRPWAIHSSNGFRRIPPRDQSAKDLQGAFAQIEQQMRTQYFVSFPPQSPRPDSTRCGSKSALPRTRKSMPAGLLRNAIESLPGGRRLGKNFPGNLPKLQYVRIGASPTRAWNQRHTRLVSSLPWVEWAYEVRRFVMNHSKLFRLFPAL